MVTTIDTSNSFPLNFSYVYGTPGCRGEFKSSPADFIVQENFDLEFSNSGEHVYLHIEKEGENTHWLQKKIAEFAGVKSSDVGVAGLKDRQAITRQWFSVYLPKSPALNWGDFSCDSWKVLGVKNHSKKLRRGDHTGNFFKITLRNLEFTTGNQDQLEAVLNKIKAHGVPNYFGEQRFGREGSNLNLANDWFEHGKKIKNRNLKSMVLSAARSYVFNQVLSQRVTAANWNQLIDGDVTQDYSDQNAAATPTGPLWGRGRNSASSQALIFEDSVKNELSLWCDALEHQGLSQERRNLVCLPQDFTWQFCDADLILEFNLRPGEYATSVLREISELITE
ncbi:tRNA pseudouridine(13) synthase TruD [Sessilibacter corallicola]|uniref:tRNA pseudouridine synthase D n=1 Tax=Sessilibacter corallicola TaxID=2904075 RepID=A0ABQ0A4L9_9GAMM